MKQNVSYRGKQVVVSVPYKIRKGKCKACPRKGFTSLHHWKYAYKIDEIRKNKLLALKNTTELCYPCHELANALRKVSEANLKLVDKLYMLRKEALDGS